jgi:hypothetical protein
VNGVQVTDFENEIYPDNVDQTLFKDGNTYAIGASQDSGFGRYLDGYLAEYNFIDGQQLTPADFGETGTYGEWKPKKYGGAYGNNGFYLPFEQDYTVEGFSAVTYKGTGAVRYVGGTGFQPDLVWIKSRDHTYGHHLTDAVRGAGKDLYTDTTDDDYDNANSLQSFDSDGFTLGTDNGPNNSSKRYVAWTWDMGGSNANNTTGSINSVVRANATYGQSIVSYTGTGSTATIGHGLSSAPEWIIIKRRDAATNWPVWHTSISDGTDDFVELNSNGDKVTNEATFFTSTDPTSSVFSVGSSTQTNANNATHIAYCWHSVTGYSSFGSYTGNGNATGPTITTGFRPAFVMIKVVDRTDGGNGGWFMYDNTRSPNTGDTSAANHVLQANSNAVEIVADANLALDFLSNGFQLKASYDEINVNNGAYIYMAFADKREYAYYLDQSGNNNDWATNNLTESDISVDSPSNNFATWNAVYPPNIARSASFTLAEGNLQTTSVGNGSKFLPSTMNIPATGKWYMELYVKSITSGGNYANVGFSSFDKAQGTAGGDDFGDAGTHYYEFGLQDHNDSGRTLKSSGTTQVFGSNGDFVAGSIMNIAIDMDNKRVFIGKNGTYYLSANPSTPTADSTATWYGWSSDADGQLMLGLHNDYETDVILGNFGQDSSFAGNKTAQGNQDGNSIGDFYYTPPTGFLALCTSNLPDVAVTPSEHFNTVLYTGTGNAQSITGVGFQPDFVWGKKRGEAGWHHLFDAIRGAGEALYANDTSAEDTSSQSLTSFNVDGFSLGTAGGLSGDSPPVTGVAWNWKANGSGSSNTNGSINSTVSVNTDAGFSIVSYTGNATSGATVGHGLSKAPEMIILKSRSAVTDWDVYVNPPTTFLRLSSNVAESTNSAVWNNTAPSATVFTLGNNADPNGHTGT